MEAEHIQLAFEEHIPHLPLVYIPVEVLVGIQEEVDNLVPLEVLEAWQGHMDLLVDSPLELEGQHKVARRMVVELVGKEDRMVVLVAVFVVLVVVVVVALHRWRFLPLLLVLELEELAVVVEVCHQFHRRWRRYFVAVLIDHQHHCR